MVKILLHCRSKMDVGKSRQKPQNCIVHASAVCSEMFVWDNSAFCCWQFYFYAARGRFGHVFFSSSMCLNMTSGINDKCIWKYISLKQDTKANTRKQIVMKTRMSIKQQPKYYIYESAFMVPMRLNRISWQAWSTPNVYMQIWAKQIRTIKLHLWAIQIWKQKCI